MPPAQNASLNLRSTDFLIMAGSFLFFGFMLAFGLHWGIPRARGSLLALTSPAFYPFMVCALGLAVSGIAMVGTALAPASASAQASDEPAYPPATAAARFVMILALFVLYYLMLPRLGALIASVLVFAGMLVLGGERRIGVIAAASVGVPVVAFFIFRDLARVPLPAGILPF